MEKNDGKASITIRLVQTTIAPLAPHTAGMNELRALDGRGRGLQNARWSCIDYAEGGRKVQLREMSIPLPL
jgi:hypothetical protein